MELVFWCSPSNTFRVEVVSELAAEFQKMEDRCSWLEQPPSQVRPADRLDKATGQLRGELAALL
jgi:hypothetical protein